MMNFIIGAILLIVSFHSLGAAKVTSNQQMILGSTSSNVYYSACDIGSECSPTQTNLPSLRYNQSTNKWDMSHNGTTFFEIGTIDYIDAADSDLQDQIDAIVAGTVTDATTSVKGIVQLAGDLTGTAALPTIKSSVALGGNPTTTTQSQGNNSTRIATTAYTDTGLATKQGTLTNSAGLAAALSDERGTGNAIFSTSPTFDSNVYLAGNITSRIAASTTSLREEVRITAGNDSFGTGSDGSGIQMYGNQDSQHAGHVAFNTGLDDNGTARMVITQSDIYMGKDIWDYSDLDAGGGLVNIKDDGSGFTAGKVPLFVTVDAISTSDVSTAPQAGAELNWREESQDIATGEGVCYDLSARLIGDSQNYVTNRMCSYKENSTDLDRTSALIFKNSADGTTAPVENFRIASNGNVTATGNVAGVDLNASDDVAATDDLTVGDDATITGDLSALNISLTEDFPPMRPSFMLDFTNRIDPRLTLTRASTANYVNFKGQIVSAPINFPRLDYDPTTLESRGLLLEDARTNAFTFSEEFDNAAWTKTGSRLVVTANSITAPDTATTMDLWTEDTTTGTHEITRSLGTPTGATNYTTSIFAKAGTRTHMTIAITSGMTGTEERIRFNLATCAGTVENGTVATYTGKMYPDGKCRLTVSALSQATPAATSVVYYISNGSANSYLGTSGTIYAWGAMHETGAFATTYIKDNNTRAKDVAGVEGANFSASSWFRADEGTIVIKAMPMGLNGATQVIYTFSNTSDFIQASIRSTNLLAFQIGASGGSSQGVNSSTESAAAQTDFVSAVTYALNDTAISVNGTSPTTDSSSLLPTLDSLFFARNVAGTTSYNMRIKKFMYYPKRLTNAQIQAVSK